MLSISFDEEIKYSSSSCHTTTQDKETLGATGTTEHLGNLQLEISVRMGSNYFPLFITVLLMPGNCIIAASEYIFDVNHVDKCSLSEQDWNMKSNQLRCNKTHGYHCVPNKNLTSLIEFCYPGGRFEKGNCLELAARGVLNHVPCSNFSSGCPDTNFNSRELYKYPKCLAINTKLNCFDADVECIYSRLHERKTKKQQITTTENGSTEKIITAKQQITTTENGRTEKIITTKQQITTTENGSTETILITLLVILSVLLLSIIGLHVYFWITGGKRWMKRGLKDVEETEHMPMCETGAATKKRYVEENPVYPKGLSLSPTLDELESEQVLGDMELLLLLRRHCVDGAFENFIYLFKTRIMKTGRELLRIIESRDKNGCSLLHYAAGGGSKDILETLLQHCTECTIDDTDHFGNTLLHFACKNGQYNLCSYVLSKDHYCKCLLTKTSHSGWNAAHFTAVSGNVELFQLLHGKGEIDMRSVTKNGLNILHIACIYNNTYFCQELVKMNKKLNLPLGKADLRGWNIAHYAAMVGNKDVFKCFINKEFASQKTFDEKTVLHICCEYGHYELCELILKDSAFIGKVLHDRDDEGWNALHSAAKGGNLKVFKMIEEALKSSDPLEFLCKETVNSKTVLHICCIHKNVEICRYICNKLSSVPQKLNKVTTGLWTAAHYVAVEIKQNGTEEDLICILEDAGLDLKIKSKEGKTVLTVAFEHRNDNLINYLLNNHIELVNIDEAKLREAVAHSDKYEEMLQKALENVNSQRERATF
ncbi:uncharacterized protein LOC111110649 isoform X2 [Crassostrea virginica]